MLIIKKDILILGEGTKQGLDDTTFTAEAGYSINAHSALCIIHSALYRMYSIKEAVFYLFMVEIYQLKIRDSGLNPYPVCLGNISKYLAVDNINGYKNIDAGDVLDILKYLMKTFNIK